MSSKIYKLILEEHPIELGGPTSDLDTINKIKNLLGKIRFKTEDDRVIPLSMFYDSDNDKFIFYVSDKRQNKSYLANNSQPIAEKATGNPIKREIKLPKRLVNFFIKDTEIETDSKEVISLREEYFKELAEKEAQPGGCSACKKNQLIRAYANKLLALIQ